MTTSARKPKANHGTGAFTPPFASPRRTHRPRPRTAGASMTTRASLVMAPTWVATGPPAAAAPTACTTSWMLDPAHSP